MAKPIILMTAQPRSAFERVLSIVSPLAAIGGLMLSIRMARRAIKADEERSATINSPDFIDDMPAPEVGDAGLDVGMGEDPAIVEDTSVIDTGMGEDPADVEMG